MRKVANPAAIITGAAGGIGQALIAAFEGVGWHVVSTDIVPMERASHVVGDLQVLSDPTCSAARLFLQALASQTRGSAKAIVANAAYQCVKPMETVVPEDWQRTLAVNVLSPFWLTHAFLAELERNAGTLLAISSIHERLTKPGFITYSTSKAALSGMIRSMAVDLGGRIRCNAICPAAIGTAMLHAGFEGQPEAFQRLEAHHPIGRIGTPDEVAATALFLCSDVARFINGACVDISGGISARLHDPV